MAFGLLEPKQQFRRLAVVLPLTLFYGCQKPADLGLDVHPIRITGGETIAQKSDEYYPLAKLPPRNHPIRVAVYEMPDLTGATRKNPNYADFSKAVSQGAEALLIEALKSTGETKWFKVLERKNLSALSNERSIRVKQTNETRQIRHTQRQRNRIAQEKKAIDAEINALRQQIERDYSNQRFVIENKLPPKEVAINNLRKYEAERQRQIEKEVPFSAFEHNRSIGELINADYIVMGSIFAYDSDIINRGSGIRYQNTGVFGEVRKDTVGINLRLVRVTTGEIVSNTNVSQTILSKRIQGDFLNYLTLNKILEVEAGAVVNEPKTLALDAAIRLGVFLIIKEMQEKKVW